MARSILLSLLLSFWSSGARASAGVNDACEKLLLVAAISDPQGMLILPSTLEVNTQLGHYQTLLGVARIASDGEFNFKGVNTVHGAPYEPTPGGPEKIEPARWTQVDGKSVLTSWELPVLFAQRLYSLITAPRSELKRYLKQGLGPLAFLAGLEPWAVDFWNLAYVSTNALSLRELASLKPGKLVMVDFENRGSSQLHAVALGNDLFLALPVEASTPLVIVHGKHLANAFSGATVCELLVKPEFANRFSVREGVSYENWNRLRNVALTWQRYDFLFMAGLRHAFLNNSTTNGERLGVFLHRMQQAGHPDFAVYSDLGIQVDASGRFDENLTLGDLVQSREKRIRRLAEGKPRGSVPNFRFARAFYDAAGVDHFVLYGGAIDPDWTEHSLNRTPGATLATMLESEMLPASLIRPYHDLEHAMPTAQDPVGYGASFLKLIRRIRAPTCRFPKEDQYVRVVYAWETLSLVPDTEREKLRKWLHPNFKNVTQPVTVKSLKENYQGWRFREDIVPHLRNLLREFPYLNRGYGGAARDYTTNYLTSSLVVRLTAPGAAGRLHILLNAWEKALELRNAGLLGFVFLHELNLEKAIVHELSRLEALLWNSTFLTASGVIDGFLEDRLRRDTPLYQFVVASGAFDDIDGTPRPGDRYTLVESLRRFSRE